MSEVPMRPTRRNPRSVPGYEIGSRHRVLKPAELTWIEPIRDGRQSAHAPLKAGGLLTCLGQDWDWGADPGLVITFEAEIAGKIVRGKFFPSTSDPDDSRPLPGYLERIP